MIFLAIMVLAFSLSVSAEHGNKKDINQECQSFGFDFGVSIWKWEKKMWWEWNKKEWNSNNDPFGTSATGTHNAVDWDVGTLSDFGLTGIVVKSGKDHYAVNGTSGTITKDKPIEHITFCFKPQCQIQPPPPPPSTGPAAAPNALPTQ